MGFDCSDECEAQTPQAAAPSLEYATKLSQAVWLPGWWLTVVPDAGEAGGSLQLGGSRSRGDESAGVIIEPVAAADPDRSSREANRRARSKLRRYCAANRLNRLGTLTYRGDGNHDPDLLRRDVGGFWIELRGRLGGQRFPYVWVPEWHPGGHGLHVHFVVGRYVRKGLLDASWCHGFTHIKQIGGAPIGSGSLGEARIAARYLGKYVGKGFDDDARRAPGRHRYEVAQGFQPRTVRVRGGSQESALYKAELIVGRKPLHIWRSSDERDWTGPPVIWVQY